MFFFFFGRGGGMFCFVSSKTIEFQQTQMLEQHTNFDLSQLSTNIITEVLAFLQPWDLKMRVKIIKTGMKV